MSERRRVQVKGPRPIFNSLAVKNLQEIREVNHHFPTGLGRCGAVNNHPPKAAAIFALRLIQQRQRADFRDPNEAGIIQPQQSLANCSVEASGFDVFTQVSLELDGGAQERPIFQVRQAGGRSGRRLSVIQSR